MAAPFAMTSGGMSMSLASRRKQIRDLGNHWPETSVISPPNVGAHPRRLRRASDGGGVGCSAVLGRRFRSDPPNTQADASCS